MTAFLGPPLTLTWISGAEAKLTPNVCPKRGKTQQYIFVRPSGVPGAEIDVEYYKAAQEGLDRRVQAAVQARDVQKQNVQAFVDNFAVEFQRQVQWQQYLQALRQSGRLRTDCTSRIVGQSVCTSCY
jgi:hypothetical protein